MSFVRVGAVRIASILRNRRIDVRDLDARVGRDLRLTELVIKDRDVELDDLIALASALNRPWPYLLIDEAEAPPPTDHDHRTVANRAAGITAELVNELESTAELLDAAAELFPDDVVRLPEVRVNLDVNVETAGARVRGALDVSVERQRAAKDDYAALRTWVSALHSQNIYVAQRHLEDPTVRAFSLRRAERCFVVVDTRDTPNARVFSVVHEYVHLLMHSAGICDLDDRTAIERYCNAVAGAALLPPHVLAPERAWPWGNSADDDDARLRQLSRHEHVSQAAILIRLKDLGILTQELFNALDSRRQQRRPEKAPGGTYYPTEINKVGRKFAGDVLASLDAGRLARQDAAALLGIAEHNVARYRVEFAGSAG